MSLVKDAFEWNTATPVERGEMVRAHAFSAKAREIPEANLLNLFQLTERGLQQICEGDDWRPEYERHS